MGLLWRRGAVRAGCGRLPCRSFLALRPATSVNLFVPFPAHGSFSSCSASMAQGVPGWSATTRSRYFRASAASLVSALLIVTSFAGRRIHVSSFSSLNFMPCLASARMAL